MTFPASAPARARCASSLELYFTLAGRDNPADMAWIAARENPRHRHAREGRQVSLRDRATTWRRQGGRVSTSTMLGRSTAVPRDAETALTRGRRRVHRLKGSGRRALWVSHAVYRRAAARAVLIPTEELRRIRPSRLALPAERRGAHSRRGNVGAAAALLTERALKARSCCRRQRSRSCSAASRLLGSRAQVQRCRP